MNRKEKGNLLFSIDLEDVRDQVANGGTYREGVPENTQRYLEFLQQHNAKATFFVVGNVARKYPSLIKEIIADGHEIACHSDTHIQINKQTPQEFLEDIRRNLDSLYAAGAEDVIGYRAPTFSLTRQTQWAYECLLESGIRYSSSVLPAANPLYGWKEFGLKPKYVQGIFEIPITLHAVPFLRLPLAGGVYFRVIPYPLINYSARSRIKQGSPITTYLHPYDIDTSQEHFMHPDLNNKKHLNYLMYINRSKVLKKLESLLSICKPTSYKEYYLSHTDTDKGRQSVSSE